MDELESLQKKIAELQEKAQIIQNQRRNAALHQAKELVHSFGLTAKELGIHVESHSAPVKGEAKYKFGAFVWTGKGRKPQWVVDHLATGESLDDLKIAK